MPWADRRLNGRFGSKADVEHEPADVRYAPESRHWPFDPECPFVATSGHFASAHLEFRPDSFLGTASPPARERGAAAGVLSVGL